MNSLNGAGTMRRDYDRPSVLHPVGRVDNARALRRKNSTSSPSKQARGPSGPHGFESHSRRLKLLLAQSFLGFKLHNVRHD